MSNLYVPQRKNLNQTDIDDLLSLYYSYNNSIKPSETISRIIGRTSHIALINYPNIKKPIYWPDATLMPPINGYQDNYNFDQNYKKIFSNGEMILYLSII